MDEQLILDCELPGVRPIRQQRTRELVIRFFRQGVLLLNEFDFEDLSIETLCERCDTNVGSFYGRFESKEAFVNALQWVAVEDARRKMLVEFASAGVPTESAQALLYWVAGRTVAWYRLNVGLVRASLRNMGTEPKQWAPLRELGQQQMSLAVPLIVAALGGDASEKRVQRVRFAFQMLYGTLNTMILINPGPFTVQHRETPALLANAMLHLME